MSDRHNNTVDTARRLAELRQESAEPAADQAVEDLDFEPLEEKPAFSMVSADRMRKAMVDFRMLDGDRAARTYSFLAGIDFNPSNRMEMDFSGSKVTITGRNLEPLYDALVAQRVAVVREMDDLQAEANLPADAVVVTKIEIKPVE